MTTSQIILDGSGNPSEPVLPLDSVVASLKSSVGDVEWMLGEIESQHGWFRFPTYITQAIENLKIQSYPLLYTNERAIAAMFLRGFMDEAEIREFCDELEAASLEERGVFLQDCLAGIDNFIENLVIPKTPVEQEAATKEFLALSADEQKTAAKVGQHFFCFFLSSFFQSLSVMVHGEKLTSLVSQAIAGSDEAFVKAVQIDRRILTEIPFFRERFARSQFEVDQDFSDRISYRLKNAPYRGRIRYKSLWYAFAILDQAGWLNNMAYREIREICDEVALDGFENRIQSDKHLGNRVREYREFQKRGIVTTT